MISQEAINLGNPKVCALALILRAALKDLVSLCKLLPKYWFPEDTGSGIGQLEAEATLGPYDCLLMRWLTLE
jgi:hypothetical protein